MAEEKKLKSPINTIDKFTARIILEEVAQRYGDTSQLIPKKEIDFNHDLFEEQRKFINDNHKFKAALCGRRSGKTVAAAYYLIKTAYENAGTDVAYIALARDSAKKIIWNELISVLERYKIQHDTNIQSLQITLQNKSRILLTGASTEREIDKHRGMHYKLVVIDECATNQMVPLLPKLVNDILQPCMRDYEDSTMCMISNAGSLCAGLFYEATTGQNNLWKTYHWNMDSNSKLPKWKNKANWKEIAEKEWDVIMREEGLTVSSPKFRREYKSEWVLDNTVTVYQFDPTKNVYSDLPKNEYNYIFGLDYGIEDSSAIVVLCYSLYDPNMYVVKTWKKNHITPSVMAAMVKELYDVYQPIGMVADSGGLGKAFVAEFESRYQFIPIIPAEKRDKVAFITLLNDDFIKGRIKIQKGLYDLIEELSTYQWSDPQRKILPATAEDHLSDAFLYAWRQSLHYIGKNPIPKPKEFSKEWEDDMWKEERDKLGLGDSKQWWEKI